MQRKLITLVASLVVLVSLGSSAAAAPKASCPELQKACRPGEPARSQKPRVKASVPKLIPKAVDSQGRLWRAGNHIIS